MSIKLFDSELKVMEVLWDHDALPAREIASILTERIGWNKNTTYTVIKKCIEKGAIERTEPGFLYRALISRSQTRKDEAYELVDKLFGGSPSLLFASLVDRKTISPEERDRLRRLIDELE